MEFSDWLTRKYIEWRGDAFGHARSMSEFAAWVGVSPSLMSQWMAKGGKVPQSSKNISKLVDRFGEEVYSVLGLPHPQERNQLAHLPPDMRRRLQGAMLEIESELAARGISADSPEGEVIVIEIMGKFGFKYTDTEKLEE